MPDAPDTRPLTVREHMIVKIGTARYGYEAGRIRDARVHLGLTETRFHQLLGALLDRPAAHAAYPVQISALRRLREQRRAQRRRTIVA